MNNLKDIYKFPEWINWTKTNIKRGCDIDEITKTLENNSFSKSSITSLINDQSTSEEKQEHNPQPRRNIPLNARNPAIWIESDNVEIFTVDDILKKEECERLINLSEDIFKPSLISTYDPDKFFRTSETADLFQHIDPIVSEIDKRIADYLGISLEYSETTQIQRYKVGQQFKSHTDYFEPNSPEYKRFCNHCGNRTWTFMVYLNDVQEGGETHFKNIPRTFSPKMGMGIGWNNRHTNGDVNYDTLHAGLPVISGSKYVITKWFRERQVAHD